MFDGLISVIVGGIVLYGLVLVVMTIISTMLE